VASALLAGFLLGLAIAASPGPMGLLCVRRTLGAGWAEGFSTGLGVATADAVYAGLAAGGIVAISKALVSHQRWLALAGGLALVTLGLHGLRRARSSADGTPERVVRTGVAACYLGSVGLTLANPSTIMSFAAAFSGLSALANLAPPLLVAGTFVGSASWWLLLSGGIALARRRLSARAVHLLRAGSAAVLVMLGLVAIMSALVKH
jgi:threonine/homoserine/homoserine lactone efflux protein